MLVVGLLVLTVLSGDMTATGSPGSVNGRIAYERDGFYGGSEVWTMNQDGSEHRRVGVGRNPSWSSDGARLVMNSERGEIVLVDEDGSDADVVEVEGALSGHSNPALSPDGSTIAFGGGDGLYVVPSAGGVARRIATGFRPAPSWSPDGTRIAFVGGGGGGTLQLIDPDGSGAHTVGGAFANFGSRVSWSPDGAWIAYADRTMAGITAVSVDGEHRRTLARDLVFSGAEDPTWSPDGTRIAFADYWDICVVNADGTGLGRLTYAPHDEIAGSAARNIRPAWQPLAPGNEPSGAPVAPSGPTASWDRRLSWAASCVRQSERPTLTAEVASARTHVGGVVTYRLRLANRSQIPLGEFGTVGFVAVPTGGLRFVSLTGGRGACSGRSCRFGSLFPGEHVDAALRVQARKAGEFGVAFAVPYRSGIADPEDFDLVVSTRIDRCTIRGTRRADALSGTSRADVLCGLEGNDRLRAAGGTDVVHAGPGNDVVDVRDGRRDHVVCGHGTDTVAADRYDRLEDDCERRTR